MVSPRNSPVRLGVSPAAASTPIGVFNQWFELYFPTLELWVVRSVAGSTSATSLPAAALPTLLHNPPPSWVCQPLPCWVSSPPDRLPVSAPPTDLDECFFFISLVLGLPYSSIFCQFWLFFVFKLLLTFFWLCGEAQCVYLRLYLGRKSSK